MSQCLGTCIPDLQNVLLAPYMQWAARPATCRAEMIVGRIPCRQSLYDDAIFCSLCRHFYDKTGRDQYMWIILCNGHSFHVGCFHAEYQDRGVGETMLETCIQCHEALPIEETSKFRWYSADSKYSLYATLLEGYPSLLELNLKSASVISPSFYARLVREALSRKLLPMAECLKRNQHRHLSLDEQKDLIIELFKNPSVTMMCWVFNSFDLSFVSRLWGRQLSWYLLEKFISAEAYNELYTVTMNDFERVDDRLLTEIGRVLYKVLMRQPGKLTYCLPSTIQDPYRLFEEFCAACPERSGFICQQIFPSTMESYYANDEYSDDTECSSSDSDYRSDSDLKYHSESCFDSSNYGDSDYFGSEYYASDTESSDDSCTTESESSDVSPTSESDGKHHVDTARIHWMGSRMPEIEIEYDLLISKKIIRSAQLCEEEKKDSSGSEAPAAPDWEVIEDKYTH